MKKSIFMLWLVVLFTASAGIFIGCPNKPVSEEDDDDITFEAELFVIEFDKNAISCKKGNEVFYSGRGAEAETVLTFTAKLEAGESVKEWLINGKNVVGQTEKTFKYTVKKTDAKEKNGKKVIKIQFVKNSPIDNRITIKFDKNEIKCTKHDSNGFLQTVSSGEKIAVGVELTFNAVLTGNETTVEKWFVNGTAKENQTLPTFVYTVDAADATPQKEITISYTKKEIPKFFISFDKNKAECKKNSEKIMPDTEVKEDDTLAFTAIIDEGDAIDSWYIHDKKRPNSGFKNFTYRVKTSDAKEINGKQTIVISYEMKENIILKFNNSEIKCQIMGSFDWKDFTGTTIHKDDKLKFTANLGSGETVSQWLLNGNKKADGVAVFEYTVAVADAVEDSDGKKVIEVKVIKQ